MASDSVPSSPGGAQMESSVPPSPHRQRMSKISIDFITSPRSPPTRRSRLSRDSAEPINTPPSSSAPVPLSNMSTRASGSPTLGTRPGSIPGLANLASLPRNILCLIAYNIVAVDTHLRPAALSPLLMSCKAIHQAISFEESPRLYHDLFKLTFDNTAIRRRYIWMRSQLMAAGKAKGKPPAKPPFDLFGDPRSFAIDYRNRWETAKMMRLNVREQCMVVEGVCDREDMMTSLWTLWFLMTENDGRNVRFLVEQCDMYNWMTVYAHDVHRTDALVTGYPEQTPDKSLCIWIAMMAGTDCVAEQTPSQVDEKLFALRPYVFACSRYETLFAPWYHQRLPLTPPSSAASAKPDAAPTSTAVSDTVTDTSVPYKRFGYTWRRTPPNHTLGTYLYFFRMLDRHSSLRVGPPVDSRGLPSINHDEALFSATRFLPSIYHDREWQRNSVCQDITSSPGLPAMTFRGELEGYWRGKFLFYEYETYRSVLDGDMRALYTGPFSEQPAEIELRETIVKVRSGEIGGDGPALMAGYKEMENMVEEQRYVEAGYGHEIVSPDAPDEDGWTKEILLTGRARSAWGFSMVKGRVRAWDGMIILHFAYNRQPMGSWLWKGYLHTGGYFLGTWRDTVAPGNEHGFEGGFGVVRAGDVSYPPHLPRRIEVGQPIPPPAGTANVTGGPASAQHPPPASQQTIPPPAATTNIHAAVNGSGHIHAGPSQAQGNERTSLQSNRVEPAESSLASRVEDNPGDRGISRGSIISISGSSDTVNREDLLTPVTAGGFSGWRRLSPRIREEDEDGNEAGAEGLRGGLVERSLDNDDGAHRKRRRVDGSL